MSDPYLLIENRAKEFGNHFYKFLLLISQNRKHLEVSLEDKGVLDKVMLYKPANDISDEMQTVISVAADNEEQFKFLATYYALQYVILNIRCIDIMRMSLLENTPRLEAYKIFMKQIGRGFQKLSSIYMEKLLGLNCPNVNLDEFVVLAVGTRADQDDIDIGIIDSGSETREHLNRGIGRIVQEMLKGASNLHLHISEHVGTQSYSASIEEYQQLLDHEIHDFVLINEMLNAWPIFGSWELFKEFQRVITRRYYYTKGSLNIFHEGFVRGMLGEIRSLRILNIKEDRLHPKEDALRLIKGMMFISKTILNIEEVGLWDIITLLKNHPTRWQKQYLALEESLIFIETFRFLYQLFICQSEDIFLKDRNDWKNLNIVAKNMGYRDMGVIKAWNHLLIAYHQYVQQAHTAIDELFPWVREHLERNSVIAKSLRRLRRTGVSETSILSDEDNLFTQTGFSIEFNKKMRFFRGIQFWDDILDTIIGENGKLLQMFVEDIRSLPVTIQNNLIKHYAQCGYYSSISLMTILLNLSKNIRKWKNKDLFNRLNEEFCITLQKLPAADERLIRIFNYRPTLINEYFKIIPQKNVYLIAEILKQKHWDEKIEAGKIRLLKLLYLHKISSRYFNRFLTKMTDKRPESIKFLDKSEKMSVMSMGILGKVEETVSFKLKKIQLGDYYDMEFLRVGILTLLGEKITKTSALYTQFVDNYLQMLFNVCKQEVDFETGKRTFTKDLLAVFSTGGHAREQAFDNDYDLIVALNSTDKKSLDYSMKIISKMNSEIIKRGTLPHFRFADYFGKYVTTFEELKQHLQSDCETLFIDKSQLLGCRMVVGSKQFFKDFMQQIINPYILDKNKEFIIDMVEEYFSRHEGKENEENHTISLDVKDCKGGLRDIEMLLMIYKAYYRIKKNISKELFQMIINAEPSLENEIKHLQRTFNLLAHLRDMYRLTVAADDEVFWEELQEPLTMLYSVNIRHEMGNVETIKKRTLRAIKQSRKILDQRMKEFYQKEKKSARKRDDLSNCKT